MSNDILISSDKHSTQHTAEAEATARAGCSQFADTNGLLVRVNEHSAEGMETGVALTLWMAYLDRHEANIERGSQAELPLFGGHQ